MCVSPTSIHETYPHTTTSGVTFLCFYVSRKELELSSICISSSPWTVTSLKGVLENSIFSTLLYFQWHFSIFMIFSTTDVSWMVFQLNCPQASSDHYCTSVSHRMSDNRDDLFCPYRWFIAEIVSHTVRSHQSCHNCVSMNYSWFVKPQTLSMGNVEVWTWLCLRMFSFLTMDISTEVKSLLFVPCWVLGQLWEVTSISVLKEFRQQITKTLGRES